LSKYLLSETHGVGKAKAKYFRALGYTDANADKFSDALINIAKSERVSQKATTPYGKKYTIEGDLAAPGGATARIRTV